MRWMIVRMHRSMMSVMMPLGTAAARHGLLPRFARRDANAVAPFSLIYGAVAVIHGSSSVGGSGGGIDFAGVPSVFAVLVGVGHAGDASGGAIVRISLEGGSAKIVVLGKALPVSVVVMAASRMSIRRNGDGRRRPDRFGIIVPSPRGSTVISPSIFMIFLLLHIHLSQRRIRGILLGILLFLLLLLPFATCTTSR